MVMFWAGVIAAWSIVAANGLGKGTIIDTKLGFIIVGLGGGMIGLGMAEIWKAISKK